MANANNSYDASQQQIFKRRVEFFLLREARAAMAEALVTAGHDKRVNFATLLFDGAIDIGVAAAAVAGVQAVWDVIDPNLSNSGLNDNLLETHVKAVYNDLAGVETGV